MLIHDLSAKLIYRLYVLKCITSLPALDVDRAERGIDTTLGGRQGQIREGLNPPFLSLPPSPSLLPLSPLGQNSLYTYGRGEKVEKNFF